MTIPDCIKLVKTGAKGRKSWADPKTGEETLIEGAAASFLRERGYRVPYNEPSRKQKGGDSGFYWCILNSCLLAAMFEHYDHRDQLHKEIFEDIFFQGPRLRKIPMPSMRNPITGEMTEKARIDDHEKAISEAAQRSRTAIEKNLKSILPKYLAKYGIPRTCFGEDLAPTKMASVSLEVFDSLGFDRLLALQTYRSKVNFAVEGKGWPDLALWNSRDFLFVEVKGPNDKLAPHQRARIEEIISLGIVVHTLEIAVA